MAAVNLLYNAPAEFAYSNSVYQRLVTGEIVPSADTSNLDALFVLRNMHLPHGLDALKGMWDYKVIALYYEAIKALIQKIIKTLHQR